MTCWVWALIGTSLFAIFMVVCGYYRDKKVWNNGVCHCEKGFWISFDMDSGGSIGYRCSERCGNYIWINGYIGKRVAK